MIVDGFDYGDDWVPAGSGYERDRIVQWWDIDSKSWRPRWPKDSHPDRASNYAAGFSIRQKYRRPMTEAEKQAEKAKEEKVKEERIAIKSLLISEYGNTPSISLSEAVEISGLQCVSDEKERQRKEKEININDWYWSAGRPRKCTHRDGVHVGDGKYTWRSESCHKITDPAFVAMLEAGAKP